MITQKEALKNIREHCEKRLKEIYPAGIPDIAAERFGREFAVLKSSETVLHFETYRLIASAARRMSIPIITSNGTFLAYLLGYMGVNPLPAHYYCSKCGKCECDENYKIFGIDLPEKTCECGNKFISMGIGIPFECVWGEEKFKQKQDLTIRSVKELLPFAKKAFEELFGEERVIPYGIKGQKPDGTPSIYWIFGGFAVLPGNIKCEDVEDEICWLENGEECLDGKYVYQNNFFRISLYPEMLMKILYECQKQSGIFAADIPLAELSKINYKSLISLGNVIGENEVIEELKPTLKGEMSRILSAMHSTVDAISQEKNFAGKLKNLFDNETFKKYPFIEREDLFIYLTEHGVTADDAVKANIYFRKGRCSETGFREILDKYNFSEDFYEAVCKYKYLFPKYHNGAFLYTYLLLAKYSKYDRKGYLNILNKFYN